MDFETKTASVEKILVLMETTGDGYKTLKAT